LQAAMSWRSRLATWASSHVQAAWFPWFLGTLNFLDYFCMVGYVTPIFQGVAFSQVKAFRAGFICFLCACGGFFGSWCLVVVLNHFHIDMGSSMTSEQSEYASDILHRWGLLAGFVNGLSPAPNLPLVLVLVVLEPSHWRIVLVLALMHLGRLVKYVGTAVVVGGGTSMLSRVGKRVARRDVDRLVSARKVCFSLPSLRLLSFRR